MKLPLTFLLVFALLAGATGCGEKCRNEQVAVVPSPSGNSRVVVFHRNCGATTAANTQVSVLPKSASLANIPGNALILGGDVPVQARWESETSVTISGMGTARVFKQNTTAADIAVTYK